MQQYLPKLSQRTVAYINVDIAVFGKKSCLHCWLFGQNKISGDGVKMFELERWSISRRVLHMSLVLLPAGGSESETKMVTLL